VLFEGDVFGLVSAYLYPPTNKWFLGVDKKTCTIQPKDVHEGG